MLAVLLATALTIARDRPLARFDPTTALGATIDAHDRGEMAKILRRENVSAMLSAGFQPLAYRLATELCGEAWHWNPEGTWSDAKHERGYWISSDDGPPIVESYGYRLPRRGNTLDQAHNDDYSRIDDGDASTFWKSNPYLASPQWVVVDLGTPRPIDAIRIRWARPYAAEYELQYWVGGKGDAMRYPIGGNWVAIEAVHDAHGGAVAHRFPRVTARWIRVLMTKSAGGPASNDWRDRAGFAMAEISILDAQRDWVRHAASHDHQTIIWVSSTDPWHREEDLDDTLAQPGFDRVVASGLTRGLPMLMPIALLYGTPDDAAAEIRYLRRRGIPMTQIEMGEEPDGQYVSPEDYAALYLRFASAIHDVDPKLTLGGPAFQSTRDFVAYWRDAQGRTSWIGRFVDALRVQNRLTDFGFFSFEWYPVDDVCTDAQEELVDAPRLYANVVARWRNEGLPESVPLLVTEYGWSSFAAKEEIGMTAALFNADFVADFLASGGSAAYFYGLEPETLIRESTECPSYGNLTLFVADRARRIIRKVPAYYAAQLVTQEWLAPRGMHEVYAVSGTDALLRAWAVRRPDGSWATLIINKDEEPRTVAIDARSMSQYAEGDGSPHQMSVRGPIELPPHSITVAIASPPILGTPAPAAPAPRPTSNRAPAP